MSQCVRFLLELLPGPASTADATSRHTCSSLNNGNLADRSRGRWANMGLTGQVTGAAGLVPYGAWGGVRILLFQLLQPALSFSLAPGPPPSSKPTNRSGVLRLGHSELLFCFLPFLRTLEVTSGPCNNPGGSRGPQTGCPNSICAPKSPLPCE